MTQPMTNSSNSEQMESGKATQVIELRHITKRFRMPDGAVYSAIRDLTLSVEPGEFFAVVGPTGCGKTIMLSLISGCG